MITGITRTIKQEPVQVQGLFQAALVFVVTLGLNLSDAHIAAVLALSASVLALIAKTQVTPLSNPHDNIGRQLMTGTTLQNGSKADAAPVVFDH